MSDKPLLERLQVKGDRVLAVVNASPKLAASLALAKHRAKVETADVVLAFAPSRADLDKMLKKVLPVLKPAGILWVAYPKLTSPLAGDLSRNVIHDLAPKYGLDTVSQIAVDDVWSALRFKRLAS